VPSVLDLLGRDGRTGVRHPAHVRTTHPLHVHEDEAALPDGTTLVAVSHDDGYDRDLQPDYGLYLDPRWAPPWPHQHVDWPDFGVPSDVGRLGQQLRDLLVRARNGQRVEQGCLGGHGRTGTALACLVVLADGGAADATAWVRSHYCERAVETPDQEALVRTFPPAD
jgi:hypothetical protein